MTKLTVKGVERARAGRHADGLGLYLLVSNTGAKSWVLRVQVYGRRRDIGLGSVSDLTLAEARDKARELRKIAKSGSDPIAARDKVKAEVPTFEAAAEACHEARGNGWEKRHADAFLACLKQHAFPRIGRLLGEQRRREGHLGGAIAPVARQTCRSPQAAPAYQLRKGEYPLPGRICGRLHQDERVR